MRQFTGTARSEGPLHELTIRELIIELSKVEEVLARQPGHDRDTYAGRSITQREQMIIAELRSRRVEGSPKTQLRDSQPATHHEGTTP